MLPSLPIYVVLVAGGQGTRMGTAIPKQFLEIEGKPILYHTLKAFGDAIPQAHFILVLPAQQISYAQMVLQHLPERIDITIVTGGNTRFHSVQNGLKAIETPGIVLVHDGVRPLVSADLIHSCVQQAFEKGSAVPAINISDSVRRILPDESSTPVKREDLKLIQTPQTFKTEILLPAFEQEYREQFTDEATVCEAAGQQVWLIDGEKNNIKITTPEDILVATALMNSRNSQE